MCAGLFYKDHHIHIYDTYNNNNSNKDITFKWIDFFDKIVFYFKYYFFFLINFK